MLFLNYYFIFLLFSLFFKVFAFDLQCFVNFLLRGSKTSSAESFQIRSRAQDRLIIKPGYINTTTLEVIKEAT